MSKFAKLTAIDGDTVYFSTVFAVRPALPDEYPGKFHQFAKSVIVSVGGGVTICPVREAPEDVVAALDAIS